MKCSNCGIEFGNDYLYCPNCGTATMPAAPEPVSLNPTADRVLAAFKDNLFLALCILISAATAATFFSGSLPVIGILITIFIWITYAKSRKGIVDTESLRCVSGSVYAQYIIGNVLFSIGIVCGIVITMVFAFFTFSIDEILNELKSMLAGTFSETIPYNNDLILFTIKIIGPIITVISIVGLILNIFSMRKIHRFIKSVYIGVNCQYPCFVSPGAAKNWLIVYCVFYIIDTIGYLSTNIFLAIPCACWAVACLIAAMLIKKYFTDPKIKTF